MAVAAGEYHSMGLGADGRIVGWGEPGWLEPPLPNADFVAVSAAIGGYHTMGLKADGAIVAWGWCGVGECDVPPPNADFVAVAAG